MFPKLSAINSSQKLVLPLWLITLALNAVGTSESKAPTIVFFIADDLGWDDVGFHGSQQVKTPNIDALAADGIVLDNYYVASACTPSRGALLSAVHPIHSSTQNWVILTAEPRGLPLDLMLLPEYLKAYGYKSHAVGKWHLGFFKKEYTPTFRGFDSHVGYWSGAGDYYDHTALEDKTSWGLDFRHNLEPIRNATGIYSTEYFTQRALSVIDGHNRSEPLFLYVSYQAVHGANHYARLQAPQRYIDQFPHIEDEDRRIFAAMLLAMDESIGILFNKLSSEGLLDNSIVLFTSDNGGPASGFSGNAACNWPLRGTKASLWEGGVRVPAALWSPLLKQTGYVSDQLMHITDWVPTLLSAIEGKAVELPEYSEARPIYGVSQWDALSNRLPSPRKEVLLNIDPIWNVSSIRVGKYKLVQGLVFPKWAGWYPPYQASEDVESRRPQQNAISRVLKKMRRRARPENVSFVSTAVHCGAKPANASTNCQPNIEHCLYDIESDPCEFNNIAADHPTVVADLWNKILAYNSTASRVGREPLDPASWPPAHGYTWDCWQDA